MSPRSLHHYNLHASMVSGHLQSSTRVLQHKSGLLGGEVTMCERTLNTDYTANLTDCRAKAAKLFPGFDKLSQCKLNYADYPCQIEIACRHCDQELQSWMDNTQANMNSIIRDLCQDSAGSFLPYMCPITAAPTTKLTTTIPTTHNSTTRAPFPKWAIYTLASGVIIVIVLVFLILWYGWSRLHHHASSPHHDPDSKQSLKSTRTHKSSSSRGSGSQANQHQHTAKSIKWYPQNRDIKNRHKKWCAKGRSTNKQTAGFSALKCLFVDHPLAHHFLRLIKKATKATPTLKKASSGKVASHGKATTSSPRRHEAKQRHTLLGPKMVNPKQLHSTGNVKKGH